MIKGKKGAVESETIHVTGLIILIAILIIIYMLLIPPEAQEDILKGREISDDFGSARTGTRERIEENTFLLESPGFVFPETKDKDTIKIPSVNLFSKTSQKVIPLANLVSVSRSLLNSNYQDLSFTVINPENTNKLRLFFNTINSKGSLLIYVNNKLAFKGTPASEILPLELPASNLKTENTIRFESSSPNWKFLSINKYELKDIKVITEEISENVKESRSFSLDKGKLKKATLSYFVNCLRDTENQGMLKVFLNQFNVHSAQVICDAAQQEIVIAKAYFEEDQNTLSFEKNYGDFMLDQIELEIELEKRKPLTYFFDLEEEDLDEEFTLRLHLVPNEDDERSSAAILVNSNTITLDTERDVFSKDISAFLKEDENFIKIIPKNEFEIISLEVFSK